MDLWEIVTVSSADPEEDGMQVIVRGVILWTKDGELTQITGQLNLQRRVGTEFFRVGFDGVDVNGEPQMGALNLPGLGPRWSVNLNLVQTRSAGRIRASIIVRVNFNQVDSLQSAQFTMPVLPDNVKRAKLFHTALAHANDVRADDPRYV